MAILLRLNLTGSGLTEKEKLERLIDYSHKFTNNINFIKEKYQVWVDHDIGELGGRLEVETEEFGRARAEIHKMPDDRVSRTIVKFYGSLKLPETLEIEGYDVATVELTEVPATLTIYNKYYRKIYGCTIEINTYTIEDWEIALYSEKFREDLLNALEKTERKGVDLISCVVGFSKYSIRDVRDRVFHYCHDRRIFIEDFLKTLNEESKEEESAIAEEIRKILRPYKVEFIASVLDSFKEKFDERLVDIFKRSNIALVAGSYVLEAEKEESFRELYEELKRDFITSIKDEWPNEEKITTILRKWIETPSIQS